MSFTLFSWLSMWKLIYIDWTSQSLLRIWLTIKRNTKLNLSYHIHKVADVIGTLSNGRDILMKKIHESLRSFFRISSRYYNSIKASTLSRSTLSLISCIVLLFLILVLFIALLIVATISIYIYFTIYSLLDYLLLSSWTPTLARISSWYHFLFTSQNYYHLHCYYILTCLFNWTAQKVSISAYLLFYLYFCSLCHIQTHLYQLLDNVSTLISFQIFSCSYFLFQHVTHSMLSWFWELLHHLWSLRCLRSCCSSSLLHLP